MREQWLADSELIITELLTLISRKQELFVYTEEEPEGLITTATHICNYDGEDYLLLQSDGALSTGQQGFVVYRQPDQTLSRGFSVLIKGSTPSQVAASLPREIFQIQRRQHPRIVTPTESEVIFYRRNEQIRNTMQVADISAISARFSGLPRQELYQGSKLEDLTLYLRRQLYGNQPHAISLRSAEVIKVRLSHQTPGQLDFAIGFHPSMVERDQLALYIESRMWESSLLAAGMSNAKTPR